MNSPKIGVFFCSRGNTMRERHVILTKRSNDAPIPVNERIEESCTWYKSCSHAVGYSHLLRHAVGYSHLLGSMPLHNSHDHRMQSHNHRTKYNHTTLRIIQSFASYKHASTTTQLKQSQLHTRTHTQRKYTHMHACIHTNGTYEYQAHAYNTRIHAYTVQGTYTPVPDVPIHKKTASPTHTLKGNQQKQQPPYK